MPPAPSTSATNEPGWQFWIDRGGTFTDVVARSPAGDCIVRKLLSENPEQYDDAAVAGIVRILAEATDDVIRARIDAIKMGTTVATNALLERRGEPTTLVTTRGFGDALRIGYQNRPDIFALNIELPEQLYSGVIEADERIDANGNVLTALDSERLQQDLRMRFEAGHRAVAICFMHAYRNSNHERMAGEIAHALGFTQISLSHEVSPLRKLIGRGDTTVADAYLSPVLGRYIERLKRGLIAAGLETSQLMFMQSNGGLVDETLFRGKDSILSGPAGGVVGMVGASGPAGGDRLIGFDMGGTSTDVSLYAGEYEYVTNTEISGVRIRSPMIRVHTVAAGGGSVLRFAAGRFQVGPESAGADPGPTAYRRGGPLTVTDANVMLGRILPDAFPQVFGPDGNQAIDAAAVRKAFSKLAQRIAQATGRPISPEQTAVGFTRIAVDNMANAIKKVSIQRGFDPAEFALCCFGGAGGQHACQVADQLGIRSILIHPLAGVLSAYGIGIAPMRAYRQLGVERPLTLESVADLNAEIQTAGDSCRAELVEQRAPLREVRVQTIAHLKVTGADATLAVDWDDVDTMRAAFGTAHRRRFGFLAAEANLVIESVRVEAIGEQAGANATTLSATSIPAVPLRQTTQIFVDEAWREASVRTRANLTVDERIDGPALIIDATSTTIVELDWSLTLRADGQIELTRSQPAERLTAYETDADPVLLEVFNSHFMNVAEQMGAVLENTAHSVNIKERLDFSCALFDRDGNLIANAPHVPVHLGSMGDSVQAIARDNANDLRPGNAYLLNTPYNGGSHLPDMTVVSPVFDVHDDRLLFFVACRAHHADIGGLTPGSMPPRSHSIHEEGVLFDNFLLVEEGHLREAELRAALGSGPYPARNPDQNVADLSAQLAANEKGANELRAMLEHFGTKAVHAYMEHVQANAEACVRAVIDRLDDGECSLKLDNGATIAVRIRVDSKRREASIDFTGTSAQSANNFNAPVAVTRAAMLYVFRTLVDENIPLNAGCLIPLKLKVPDQSLLSPGYPAAVVAGNVETSQCVTNALYGALGTLAGSQGTMNNLTFGNAQHQYYETICGGAGAGPTFAGASAVHTAMTNSRMTDPEVLEARYPVRVCEFSVRRGSGGNGRYRGGDGVMRKLEFLEPMQAAILSNNRTTQPRGQSGGEPGQAGRNAVLHPDGSLTEHGPVAEFEVEPGDILIIETPGGGGWGKSDAR